MLLFCAVSSVSSFSGLTNWCTPESNIISVLFKARFLRLILPECFFSPVFSVLSCGLGSCVSLFSCELFLVGLGFPLYSEVVQPS